eukprot:5984486-Amphidinium_carterae.1
MQTTLGMTVGSFATVEDSGEKIPEAELRADPTIAALIQFHAIANQLRRTRASRMRPGSNLHI